MGREGTTCGEHAGGGYRRGEYRLSTFLTAGLLAAAWFATLNPWRGVPFLLPAVLAATVAAFGAGPRAVRRACLAMAVLGCLLCLGTAVANYPIIVVADSDLGSGAMQVVGDCLTAFAVCLSAATVVGLAVFLRIPTWLALSAGLLVLAAAALVHVQVMPHESRWALVTLVAVFLAVEGLPAFSSRALRWFPFGPCGWILFFPALVVMADWQGRIYFGLLPLSSRPQTEAEELPKRSSASMGPASQVAVCPATGLRARGDAAGGLTVENLHGGPAFHRAPSAPDRMLDLVLFSPDGSTLDVADNHRMYQGSAITIWDVAPGDRGTPPQVTLRHELGIAEHYYFSLAFFPDGRTLISSNGDNTVRLWDVSDGRELARFVPHARPNSWDRHAYCVAASPHGKTFATWAYGEIEWWDRETLRLLRQLDGRQTVPVSLEFSSDGNALVAAGRDRVYTWGLHPSALPFLSLVTAAATSLACVVLLARRTT